MKSKHDSDTRLPEYGINQWLNICMTKTHRKYFFLSISSLLAKLPVVWFLSRCCSLTLFLEHRLQAHGLCYQRSPLISSQHHTSSVIWPINKLQRGVGVVRALPARPLSTTGRHDMFQLLGSLFRLFINSSSPQQIIISSGFISFTESEQLSYPSEGVIRKKQANIVATVRGAVQPDKPRLPLQNAVLSFLAVCWTPATTTASGSAFSDCESDPLLEALTSLTCCRCHAADRSVVREAICCLHIHTGGS